MSKAKIITFYSPIPQAGKSTLASFLGLGLAEKGKKVLIIELSNVSFSIALNQRMDESTKCIYKALLDPDSAPLNVIQSRLSNNLFLLSQHSRSKLTDLIEYNSENIDIIVGKFIDSFDYIFIDLPSQITDIATIRVMGERFKYPISHTFLIGTENLQCYRMLNDIAIFFKESTSNYYTNTTNIISFVINKSKDIYKNYIVDYLKTLPKYEISNVVTFPFHEDLEIKCNEGTINILENTPLNKEFKSSIDIAMTIIENNIVGVGTGKKKKETSRNKKLKSNLKNNLDLSEKELRTVNKNSKKGKSNKPKTKKGSKTTPPPLNITPPTPPEQATNNPIENEHGLNIEQF